METVIDPQTPVEIEPRFLQQILSPYKPNAMYLKSAAITHVQGGAGSQGDIRDIVTATGAFSISESCYIESTGHFNSVEFNICYNQLAYVLFAQGLRSGILQRVIPRWNENIKLTYDIFLREQLSSMLIVRIEGKFTQQLDSTNFSGALSLQRITSFKKSNFAHTSIAFSDAAGVKSRGQVTLAFNSA